LVDYFEDIVVALLNATGFGQLVRAARDLMTAPSQFISCYVNNFLCTAKIKHSKSLSLKPEVL
jgi:hypothetical protein